MLHAVIMAGGSGTRFWPQSRRSRPKQLLPLTGERTMIQATVDRVSSEIPAERTWIVTNRQQASATAEQLPDVPADNLLIEPCGRNTAPCIGLAAIRLLHGDPDAVMLVMPADHAIQPAERFLAAVSDAVGTVQRDPQSLVLFGVPPVRPATGYGYIERGESLPGDGAAVSRVASFREKPDRETAERYLQSGDFSWNCGIFVWRADTILESLKEFEPEIHERLTRLEESLGSAGWQSALATEFPEMTNVSIDYAVLERSQSVTVIEAPFEWDDVGSWGSLPRLLGTNEAGNTIDGRHAGLETTGCIIRNTDAGHLVATIGVDDLIVVHTPDATLVARCGDDDAIRTLVEELQSRGFDAFL
ncbi:MAG: mannose-1-phosphate guanylyltransferase [Planctomycetaceae bacterium]